MRYDISNHSTMPKISYHETYNAMDPDLLEITVREALSDADPVFYFVNDIHFNPKNPEFMNIYISDFNRHKGYKWTRDRWVLTDSRHLACEVWEDAFYTINRIAKLNEDTQKQWDKILKPDRNGKKYFIDEDMVQQIALQHLMYNNRNEVKSNKQ